MMSIDELSIYHQMLINTIDNETHWRFAMKICYLVLPALGFICYCIEVMILREAEFNTISFLYHKTLLAFEICICLLNLTLVISSYFTVSENFLIFLICVANPLNSTISMATEFLALVVCCERLVALLLPTKFHHINTAGFARISITICFLLGCHFMVDSFQPILEGNSGYQTFRLYRDSLELAESVLLTALSVVLGLAIRRFQQTQIQRQSKMNIAKGYENEKCSLQLSLLSVSLAIPIFICALLGKVYDYLCLNGSCSYNGAELLNFTEATDKLKKANIAVVLQFWGFLVWHIGHVDHFLVYFVLSKKFQQATLKVFSRGKSKILGKGKFQTQLSQISTTKVQSISANKF